MIELDLTAQEIDILRDVLENDVSDMRMEIADTDSMDFREQLKVRKNVLTKVLAALKESPPDRQPG